MQTQISNETFGADTISFEKLGEYDKITVYLSSHATEKGTLHIVNYVETETGKDVHLSGYDYLTYEGPHHIPDFWPGQYGDDGYLDVKNDILYMLENPYRF